MSELHTPLIIVDSAPIADCLRRIVGADFEVCSTDGQICDLPTDDMGIDPTTCVPKFRLTEGGRAALKRIRPLLPDAKTVYLATETSAAGESLAAHLASRLRLKHYRRIHLTSLTPAAVQAAMGASRSIDYSLAQSYQGRRAVDRLIGYTVSRPLAKKLGRKGLSSGRIQAAILGLLVERERQQATAQDPQMTGIELSFPGSQALWTATWTTKDRNVDFRRAIDQVLAGSVVVARSVARTIARMPPAPLTISSLLLHGSRRWGYRPEQILAGAEGLFHAGAITQPFTYTVTFKPDGLQSIAAVAAKRGLPHSGAGNIFPEAQVVEAGAEALRPTSFDNETAGASPLEQDLYAFIWARAVLSQLTAATYAGQDLHLVDAEGRRFLASARQLTSPGYLGVADSLGEDLGDGVGEGLAEGDALPGYPQGTLLRASGARILTAPRVRRGRYAPSDLAAELERLGVCRAEAAYSVMRFMCGRGYLAEARGQVTTTELGKAIFERLDGAFSYGRIPNLQALESALQAVARGRRTHVQVIETFWETLRREAKDFDDEAVEPLPHDSAPRACPKCGRVMDLANGPHGFFWACSGFALQPVCDFTEAA